MSPATVRLHPGVVCVAASAAAAPATPANAENAAVKAAAAAVPIEAAADADITDIAHHDPHAAPLPTLQQPPQPHDLPSRQGVVPQLAVETKASKV